MEFMNDLRQSDVVCTWLGSKNGIYFGKVYTKDMKTLHTMANSLNVTIEEKTKHGLLNVFKRYRKRYGILIGIVVCLVLWFIFSTTIVTIEIKGNQTVSDDAILSTLESVGIKRGAYLPNLNLKDGEYRLRLQNENIAWCSIRNNFGRVLVRIDETVSPPEMLHDNTPCNLVAKTGATIVSFSVLNGQLMTPIGNGVAQGEVLISGVSKNDKGLVRYVHAMGSVIGEYEESITLSQALTENITTTGEVTTYEDLEILGLKIPLYVGKKDTLNCRIDSQVQYFKLFGNNIPIGIVTTQSTHYSTIIKNYSVDDAKQELNSRRETFEQNFLNSVEIVNVEENYTITDESVTLNLNYTLRGNICEEQTIFIN
jgi:similar to stage IV sporulation protein